MVVLFFHAAHYGLNKRLFFIGHDWPQFESDKPHVLQGLQAFGVVHGSVRADTPSSSLVLSVYMMWFLFVSGD